MSTFVGKVGVSTGNSLYDVQSSQTAVSGTKKRDADSAGLTAPGEDNSSKLKSAGICIEDLHVHCITVHF